MKLIVDHRLSCICCIHYLQLHGEVMAVLNHIAHSKEALPEDMCELSVD